MTASPRLLGLFALAAWAAGTLALAGQETPSTPAVPVFGSEVQVIALPVFVADKSGQAVPDLTAADFEIEDGGKRAEIVGFQVVDAGASLDQPSPARSVTMDAASRRQFLLLFDFAFATAAGLHKARAGAIDFVARSLAPRDLAAVATLGPSGPNLVVGFTADKDQLRQAVSRLGMARGERLTDPLALAYDLNYRVQETQMGLVFEDEEEERERVFQLMRSDREAYSKRVGAYVAGLDSLAAMLNAVQGRKQVLLFSAGFDQSLIGGSQGAERVESSRAVTEGRLWEVQGDSYFGDAAARGGLEQLFRRLGASDAVVHTVDIGGLAAGADVADATRAPMGRGRDTLAHLASGSGGMFFKEVNDVAGALREVTDASRYFYVLGFAPVREGKAGRFRKLSVKVKRPGLRASHRVGYVVPDPKAPEPATMSRLSAGEAIAKGLSGGAFDLEALAVPMRGASDAPGLLPVVLRVDGRGLLTGVKDDALSLEVYAYALDAEGRIVDALSATPSLDLRKLRDGLQEHGLLLLTVFKAPAGAADLRFFVRHPASARAASLRILAEAPPAAWPVSAPLLMADPATRIVMPVASRANPELELPFRVGPRAFAPEVSPVLVNGTAAEVCVMARPPRGSSLEVIADLRAADGKTTSLETSGTVRLSKDRDGAFRIVLKLTPKDIPAGDYALRVTLRDEAGEEVFAEQPVGVR